MDLDTFDIKRKYGRRKCESERRVASGNSQKLFKFKHFLKNNNNFDDNYLLKNKASLDNYSIKFNYLTSYNVERK